MKRRHLTYANFKLMRAAFEATEHYILDLFGPGYEHWNIDRDYFLGLYFGNGGKNTFTMMLRMFIASLFEKLAADHAGGPLVTTGSMATGDLSIGVKEKTMPKILRELITGRVFDE